VLTYTYSKSDNSSATFVPNWGNYSVQYTANSDVYLEGMEIRNVTKLTAYALLNVDGGVTEGNWAVYSVTTRYIIGVNAEGKLSVTMTQDPISNLSEKPNPNFWSRLISLGTIDNCVNNLQSGLSSLLKDFIKDESSAIENMLNGSHSWVFPGSNTFTFQDAAFSNYQDMIAHVLYVDPNK